MSNFLSCFQFFPITNWKVDYRLVVHICLPVFAASQFADESVD